MEGRNWRAYANPLFQRDTPNLWRQIRKKTDSSSSGGAVGGGGIHDGGSALLRLPPLGELWCPHCSSRQCAFGTATTYCKSPQCLDKAGNKKGRKIAKWPSGWRTSRREGEVSLSSTLEQLTDFERSPSGPGFGFPPTSSSSSSSASSSSATSSSFHAVTPFAAPPTVTFASTETESGDEGDGDDIEIAEDDEEEEGEGTLVAVPAGPLLYLRQDAPTNTSTTATATSTFTNTTALFKAPGPAEASKGAGYCEGEVDAADDMPFGSVCGGDGGSSDGGACGKVVEHVHIRGSADDARHGGSTCTLQEPSTSNPSSSSAPSSSASPAPLAPPAPPASSASSAPLAPLAPPALEESSSAPPSPFLFVHGQAPKSAAHQTSKFTGVPKNRNKWKAGIEHRGRKIGLGTYVV